MSEQTSLDLGPVEMQMTIPASSVDVVKTKPKKRQASKVKDEYEDMPSSYVVGEMLTGLFEAPPEYVAAIQTIGTMKERLMLHHHLLNRTWQTLKSKNSSEEVRQEMFEWVCSDATEPFSFDACCRCVGHDSTLVRDAILEEFGLDEEDVIRRGLMLAHENPLWLDCGIVRDTSAGETMHIQRVLDGTTPVPELLRMEDTPDEIEHAEAINQEALEMFDAAQERRRRALERKEQEKTGQGQAEDLDVESEEEFNEAASIEDDILSRFSRGEPDLSTIVASDEAEMVIDEFSIDEDFSGELGAVQEVS